MLTARQIDAEKRELEKLARDKATAEKNYRVALMQTIFQLRTEGKQISIISDLARGMVAEFKFTRDLNDSLFTAKRESLGASLGVLTALQSILRVQKDIEG